MSSLQDKGSNWLTSVVTQAWHMFQGACWYLCSTIFQESLISQRKIVHQTIAQWNDACYSTIHNTIASLITSTKFLWQFFREQTSSLQHMTTTYKVNNKPFAHKWNGFSFYCCLVYSRYFLIQSRPRLTGVNHILCNTYSDTICEYIQK